MLTLHVSISFVKLDVKRSKKPTLYRHGAEAARGAHNSEDIGSKPIAGIIHQFASVHQGTSKTKKSGSETINRVEKDLSKEFK